MIWIKLLDSGSSDATPRPLPGSMAHDSKQRAFAGYGPQKQAAIDLATNNWVLLLDADEHRRRQPVADPRSDRQSTSSRLPTAKTRMAVLALPHPGTRPNWQLRLFDRRRARMNDDAGARRTATTERVENLMRHSCTTANGNRYARGQDQPLQQRPTAVPKPPRFTRCGCCPIRVSVSGACTSASAYFSMAGPA